uniref:Vomeronasal type-1 receptor n=1 Tax=Chelydra serpentina TaxID=8475 RepID=A0A8C3S0W5_CHESE
MCNLTYVASILIYLAAFIGMIGNLIVVFAFVSNAVRHRALLPLDRIIVNMALVNLLLCCYQVIPGLIFFVSAKAFGKLSCRILLYTYHTLRLISIWSVENLSFLHLIKIRRPNHRWSKFVYRHQGQYVNSVLVGCWIFTIVFHIPYLQHDGTAEKTNKTIEYLAITTCLSYTGTFIMKFTTYASVSLDLIFIVLVIVLNGFTIDLLCKHRRKVRAAWSTDSSWNKHMPSDQPFEILPWILLEIQKVPICFPPPHLYSNIHTEAVSTRVGNYSDSRPIRHYTLDTAGRPAAENTPQKAYFKRQAAGKHLPSVS